MLNKFETGKTYVHGWIGDSELKTHYQVMRRTAKTVWIQRVLHGKLSGDALRKGIKTVDGDEQCAPHGVYSMSPVLRASREVSL